MLAKLKLMRKVCLGLGSKLSDILLYRWFSPTDFNPDSADEVLESFPIQAWKHEIFYFFYNL
jgi:hypothetical protein